MSAPSTGTSGQGKKRKRAPGTYERRRAVTACQPCRFRKTKCDNQRPVCGFCQANNGNCVWPDTAKDHSSYDPASIAILERINHVVSLLETNHAAGSDTPDAGASQLAADGPITPATGQISTNPPDATQYADEDFSKLLELPDFLATSTNCEGILTWPIFFSEAPAVRSFVLESNEYATGQNFNQDAIRKESQHGLGKGVQEDDFIPLSRRFLTYVHVKNPILDVTSFRAMVRDISENGTRWDGPSCLVLIACALACLASPFTPGLSSYESPESVRSTATLPTDSDTAASYYLAARKRLGLLRPSLIHIQCLFLCGVFEMYSLNPMQAWFYMHQASVQFQNLLWARNQGTAMITPAISPEIRRLEQRLYWSCMKSECELRSEIPLPPSGIIRFDYPDLFPSPPTELVSPAAGDFQLTTWGDDLEPEEERSWFYYLAEISFRRMMNRAIIAVSRNGFHNCVNNLDEAIGICHDFNEQIDVWCSHLPPQINVDETAPVPNELAHYVRNRARACREWIHRPFVYYLVHSGRVAEDEGTVTAPDPRALPLAQRCLELCVELTLQSFPHHRHHGTWYVARTSMTRALILLAAARSGRVAMPDRWMEAVDLSNNTLQRWAEEAPDLESAVKVLHDIRANTYGGQ